MTKIEFIGSKGFPETAINVMVDGCSIASIIRTTDSKNINDWFLFTNSDYFYNTEELEVILEKIKELRGNS